MLIEMEFNFLCKEKLGGIKCRLWREMASKVRFKFSTFCIFQVRTLHEREKALSVCSRKHFLTADVTKTGNVTEHTPKEYQVSEINNKVGYMHLAEVLNIKNFFWSHWEMQLSEFLKIRLTKKLIKFMLDYHIQITVLFYPETSVDYLAVVNDALRPWIINYNFYTQWQGIVSIIYKSQMKKKSNRGGKHWNSIYYT